MSKSEKNPTENSALTQSQSRLLDFLESYRDPFTGECTPTMEDIATRVGLSRARVGEVISELVKSGQIERTRGWIFSDGQDEDERLQFSTTGSSPYGHIHRAANRYTVNLMRRWLDLLRRLSFCPQVAC